MTETEIEYRDYLGRQRYYPHSFDIEQLEGIGQFIGEGGGGEPMRATLDGSTHFVAIRHDVDHSIDHALRFARWEYTEGIRSSYYLLHTAWYWKQPGFGARVREIEELGHEVGLHHDSLTAVSRLTGMSLEYQGEMYDLSFGVFWSAVAKLRAVGALVEGCAAHGSDLRFDNLSVWNHWDLDDFDLCYEAYNLNKGSNYISDNRGRISTPLQHEDGKRTHLLIHPEHWQLPDWTAKEV